jgi:hypothetical protein
MRVRRFGLRLLAVVLAVGWLAAAGLVIVGYSPGGPIDRLVGLAALPTVAIALAALVWPPVARGDQAFAAIAWLGVGAALVLGPSIGSLVEQLRAGGPQTLLPSLEAAYPWLLALGGTALFAGLGIARRLLGENALRRRRLGLGGLVGAALTVASATLFAGAAIGNDLALRDRPATSSRFGPTDPALEPPECGGALAPGSSAIVALDISGEVDGRPTGDGDLRGSRAGADFRWAAAIASSLVVGRDGWARVGDAAWQLRPGGGWEAVDLAVVEAGALDLQVITTALTAGNRAAAESRGIAYVEGARARHCRIAIDGPTFRLAFPQVAWIVGAAVIDRWRGELDYWVFADGQLGQVVGSINGEGADLTPKGVLGTVRVSMTATDRGTVPAIEPPGP